MPDHLADMRHMLKKLFHRYGIPIAKRGTRGVHLIKRDQLIPTFEIKVNLLYGTERDHTITTVATALYNAGLSCREYNDAYIRYFYINGRRTTQDIPESVAVCTECGSALKGLEAIKRGIGPECAKKQPTSV